MGAKNADTTSGSSLLVVVGGGAAGYFCALSAAESNPNLSILLLGEEIKLLRKVRISGGGRCNLTHHCFDPNELSQHYPRGGRQLKELLSLATQGYNRMVFQPRSLSVKTEVDGRGISGLRSIAKCD